MNPKLALLACIIIIIWLLRVEKKMNPAASLALWIPTFWLLIMGSRPIGAWFRTTSPGSDAEGSVYDRFVLSILVLLALWVLSRRKLEWSQIFKDNLSLILLYLFLGSSILWSDFPYSSFKRWFKIAEIIVMAFMVISEMKPLQALESVFRRCAYVLIPLSLVLIKYFPYYGITYSSWEGIRMATGVTTHKNSLGILCVLSAFFLIWAIFRKRRAGEFLKSRFQTFADVLVIGLALFLLFGGESETSSATSSAILIVGMFLLLILYQNENLARWVGAHLKAIVIAMVLIFLLFGNLLLPSVSSSLGRDESLTGRLDIWRSVLDVASRNPLLGVGYGGYWGLTEGAYSRHYEVKQSHNGYLNVYLEVGAVGLAFLFAFIIGFCNKVRREINHMFDWSVFGICFLLMMLLYNYTEAGFLQADYMWTIMVLLTVVFSAPYLSTEETQSVQSCIEKNVWYLQPKN